MAKTKEATQEWIDNGIKSLAFCVFAMFTFFVNQLNGNISKLTEQLRLLEVHQVDSDKRIAEIEISRKVSLVGYEKIVQDVQDLKLQMTQLVARTQTIADFVSTNFKKAH